MEATIDMADEQAEQNAATLGELGRGSIGPGPRIEAGEISEADVDRLVGELTGNSLFPAVHTSVARNCIDGREQSAQTVAHATDDEILGPDAAGGIVSEVIGRAIAGDRAENETLSEHTGRLTRGYREQGVQVGVHIADHVHGPGCGCGACDNAGPSLQVVLDHPEEVYGVVSAVAEKVGAPISSETWAHALERIKDLLTTNYVDSGPQIIDAVRNVAGSKAVKVLTGSHNEVVAVFNTIPWTTLDRRLVRERFGDKLQVFGDDVWALAAQSRAAYPQDTEKAQLMLAGMLAYQVGVALVLCHSSLRVVLR